MVPMVDNDELHAAHYHGQHSKQVQFGCESCRILRGELIESAKQEKEQLTERLTTAFYEVDTLVDITKPNLARHELGNLSDAIERVTSYLT